jgi:AcrR family transcriptional regulator
LSEEPEHEKQALDCTGYHLRGRHVCSNNYELPMDDTNAAVLGAVGEQGLSADIVEAAIDRAVERLSTWQHDDDAERLRAERDSVEGELSRLTGALAAGGSLPSVLAAIRERETRREAIVARLGALEHVSRLPRLDRRTLRPYLQRRIEDWRAPLTKHVAQARQLLRKVLADRLTVTPEGGSDRYAAATGDATLTKILAGIVFPKGMASPTGFEPVFWP